MRLRCEVIDLVGRNFFEYAAKSRAICHVAVMQVKAGAVVVGIDVNAVETAGIEAGGATNDTVNLVVFREEELGKVRSVLAGDSCD